MNRKKNTLRNVAVALTLAGLLPAWSEGFAQQRQRIVYDDLPARRGAIAGITAPVTSIFGVYTPYKTPRYEALAGLNEPRIDPNFTNVLTAGGFSWSEYFSQQERGALQRERVAFRVEPAGSFAQAYVENAEGLAPFITLDAALQGLRQTLDEAYRTAQRDQLAGDLGLFLDALSTELKGMVSNGDARSLRESSSRALAYVETARMLLDPSHQPESVVADAVREEMKAIASGAAATSPILGTRVDYGRLTPVGPYAAIDRLSNYYRAAAWLSAAGFELEGRTSGTQAGLVMARAMDVLPSDVKESYRRLLEVESFFNGRIDDALTYDMVAGAMRGWYGFQYGMTPTYLADEASVSRLLNYVRSELPSGDARRMELRLLPFGASLTDRLFDAVGRGERGATILTALSGGEAGGARSIADRLSRIPAEEWAQDVEWIALYTANGLAGSKAGKGYPQFTTSAAWQERKMESALGLLGAYSASTATVSSTGSAAARTAVGSSARAEAVGYVEPDPEGWSLVASLAGFFKNGLTEGPNGRLINRGLAQKFEDIENSAVQLMHVAAYQLNDTPITTEHEALIASMPGRIAAWESFIDESLRGQGTPVTASAEARTSGVRPAVGHPVIVYVVAPNVDGSGELVLSRGAVYSYYESDLPQSAWLDRVVARGSASSDTRYVASAAEPFALPGDALHKVTERLTDVTASVTGRDRRSLRAEARLALEANVIRQTTGELWYTVEAPGMDGLSALTTIVSSDGRQSWQSAPYTIDRGRRYDMVPVTDLESGQYFIRVNDITGRMLASGRFMVVR